MTDQLANIPTVDLTTEQDKEPTPAYSGNGTTVDSPTSPSLARFFDPNTSIGWANSNLAHQCDFILQPNKNIALKEFLNAMLYPIREAIKAVLKALGYDPTGEGSKIVQVLKSITDTLKWIQREIIDPVIQFEKYVIEYINKLKQIIAYILSLPAQLLALLKNCLENTYKLISSILTDAITESTSDTNSALAAAKELTSTIKTTVASATQAVVVPLSLVNSVTSLTSGSGTSTTASGVVAATTSIMKLTQPQYLKSTP